MLEAGGLAPPVGAFDFCPGAGMKMSGSAKSSCSVAIVELAEGTNTPGALGGSVHSSAGLPGAGGGTGTGVTLMSDPRPVP